MSQQGLKTDGVSLFMSVACIVLGVMFCLTGIGIVVGIPLIFLGMKFKEPSGPSGASMRQAYQDGFEHKWVAWPVGLLYDSYMQGWSNADLQNDKL